MLTIGRRQLVKGSALLLASLVSGRAVFSAEIKERTEEVSPPEDLMREHGVLRRILLIYRSIVRKANAGEEIPWTRVSESAGIIRTFVEDYHEKLEEKYVFPAMRKAGKLADLVEVLLQQHQAGRRLTDRISSIAQRNGREATDPKQLSSALGQFVRMYEPHASREDTVLFPALHSVWRQKEFDKMGDLFEEEEDRLFGEHGFEKMVERVAAIEKELALYNLSEFTPKV